MQLIKPDINVDFVGKRNMAFVLSIVLILIGIGSLIVKGGPNYGVDFAGGTLVQVRFEQNTTAGEIKKALIPNVLDNATVQQFGDDANEYLIRAQESDSGLQGLRSQILDALEPVYGAGTVDMRRIEMVGPQVGQELRKQGLMAILYAMIGILAYITWRFEFRFAVGAIVALVHDVLLTLGAFSLFGKEIDLPIIAAFLAIIGYSLNDTIIVYDRIRENMGKYHGSGVPLTVNRSINETLSRTILTSGTTLLVVLALFLFGGGVIHNFAFALLIGVLVGTYSSIFVASPILIAWQEKTAGKSAP
ncbi:protein translocase subunit SecF [Desulfuromonas acetoxidans]|uniref:Protein-export membrane protein SecF n=1 Tax=Desulfuromonas acetoxidans (strain DSM 684 / 11070) TaxID=281689 RepID=Q1K1D8_DESA6|nr:protein translocase subunit SecF [Desulfuromonas acetoxidans]EAT16450.1 SecF protein [Desulfuromonas acetoxidans DSM 684]MBF0644396.1 protein translocase subunit SecF [Desulfuromonas acetoxidans]NVD23590.1 protein translocase subunit SecF [Desulfuromonas acetoxidans]NVE16025.1 protein translocase subunit SecF [Desulfuromonas acetoxidans]